jgi:hypothetical protein
MNQSDARKILAAYRPGHEPRDPEVAEALRLARTDPELQQWLERQIAFHRSMRENLRHIRVPDHLRHRILAQAQPVELSFWTRRQAVLAIAAAVVALLGLALFWRNASSRESFDTFRSRMVRTVLRQYSMAIETNDLARIRQYLGTQHAPSDFALRSGLAQLPVSGAGVLSWKQERVAMVCLNGGPRQGTLFLFVVDRAALERPPGSVPELAPVSKLMTASWTEGNRTYVLAGQGNREILRKLL